MSNKHVPTETCVHKGPCCCSVSGPSAYATEIHEDKACQRCFPASQSPTDQKCYGPEPHKDECYPASTEPIATSEEQANHE